VGCIAPQPEAQLADRRIQHLAKASRRRRVAFARFTLPDHVQHYFLESRIAIVAMCPPTAGSDVHLNIARAGASSPNCNTASRKSGRLQRCGTRDEAHAPACLTWFFKSSRRKRLMLQMACTRVRPVIRGLHAEPKRCRSALAILRRNSFPLGMRCHCFCVTKIAKSSS